MTQVALKGVFKLLSNQIPVILNARYHRKKLVTIPPQLILYISYKFSEILCVNKQISHDLIWKSEHWIKPGSIFLLT